MNWLLTALVGGAVVSGCAASSAKSAPPPGEPPAQGGAGVTAEAARPAPSPAPPAAPNGRPGAAADAPRASAAASGTSRGAALQSAATEIEASQRELDVAAGDCRNACRALGSMDRAAGRLCGLTQGSAEARRCDDARNRVYSARDRVKSTCGQCEGGPSVERSAPIPSLR